ncbi:hypothetical protein AGR1B_Lc50267 [Agrobacterium fabacearum S56]|nr:hypothetical protein AGR1B_Lc50267 [Agrobacterium fabacearum S56]
MGLSECLLLCFLLAEKPNEMNPPHAAVVEMPDMPNGDGADENRFRFCRPASERKTDAAIRIARRIIPRRAA